MTSNKMIYVSETCISAIPFPGSKEMDSFKSNLEEAKLSVRIEKANVKNNPSNKFYLRMLELAEQELSKCLNEIKGIKD